MSRRITLLFGALLTACASCASDPVSPGPDRTDASEPSDAVADGGALGGDAPVEPVEPTDPDGGTPPENGDEACRNGRDDDGDGYSDCRDFDCDGFATCGLPETTDEACRNGFDDDGDGFSDCADYGCAMRAACGPPEREAAACSNSTDDDRDGYTDCDDFGCRDLSICDPRENRDRTCTDGFDNDRDTFVDCADFSCRSTSVCRPTEDDDQACADGADNDRDGAVDCADTDCAAASPCGRRSIRIATWNIQELFGGDPPSAQGKAAIDAVVKMLLRIDADLVCLNEVHDDEAFALDAVATAAAYPYVFQAQVSTPMAGGLTNACLSRRPFLLARSRSSDDISPDLSANETGRDFAEVRVDLVPGRQAITVFSAHLKSGFTDADHLRRAVEAIRLADLVRATGAEHPSDAVVVMGDLNEERGQEPMQTFTSPPSGLPFSFRLGSDLAYPIAYTPFETLLAAGLSATEPTHEDNDDDATRIPSGRRIDWLLYKSATLVADEVFDPCRDNGVDDPPAGGRMEKAASPVPCGTAEAASDHWPVMADLGSP
ncbi:MAG: endonuclease/exonuclease/phosphatase family protein [Deltaproteobacteria bacterium]|nr:endonuclease/exonuclease/phosphatase family protein [Deltaproteobacteria bacterium]